MKRITLLIAVAFATLSLSHAALRLPGITDSMTYINQARPTQSVQLLVWTLAAVAVVYLTIVWLVSAIAALLGMHLTAARVANLLPRSMRVGLLSVVVTLASPLSAMASPTSGQPIASGADTVVMHRVENDAPAPQHTPMMVGDVVVMHRESIPSETPTPASGPPTAAATWTVKTGDSFWRIAQEKINERVGHFATEAEVAPYWLRIISANAAELVDPGNPDLLTPGQVLALPDFSGL